MKNAYKLISMIIFLYGADAFRAKEKLEELKRRFLEKNNRKEYLISAFDGDNFNFADFRNKILSAGFFAEKKMIVLKCRMQNAECRIKDNEKEILEIIKKISEETILIIWIKETDDKFLKSDLGKYLLKQKYVFEFNPLSGNALVSWVRERAKKYGCEIDNEAIMEVCNILGTDLWKIDLELSKLCAYASARHPALDAGFLGNSGDSEIPHQVRDDRKKISVTKKIVSEMLAKEAEDNIFKFIDALAAKNKRMALLSLEEEFRAGVPELKILGAMAGQIRILLQIKSMAAPLQKDMIAKQLAIHPYVAQKSLQQVKNFQLNELKNIYRELLKIDIAVKTSSAPARAIFDKMIAKL